MFLTLWKSYLLSWRTKLAKLECLNMRGRMDLVNSFMSLTTKQSPRGPQQTTDWNEGSSSILRRKRDVNARVYADRSADTDLYSFLTKSLVEGMGSSAVRGCCDGSVGCCADGFSSMLYTILLVCW